MAWTEAKVELAKSLWLEGHPAPIIAQKLGAGFSRNAVIGKMHRLGLARRVQRTAKPKVEKRIYPKIVYVRARNRLLSPERVHDTSHVKLPPSRNLTLMQRGDQDCHFLGDNGLYCGHPVRPGACYCEGHCQIVYMPPQARKRA